MNKTNSNKFSNSPVMNGKHCSLKPLIFDVLLGGDRSSKQTLDVSSLQTVTSLKPPNSTAHFQRKPYFKKPQNTGRYNWTFMKETFRIKTTNYFNADINCHFTKLNFCQNVLAYVKTHLDIQENQLKYFEVAKGYF